MKKSGRIDLRELLLRGIELCIAAAIVVISILSVAGIRKNTSENGTGRLEQSVRRAVMACYATEGKFPDSIQHLREKYGLQVDDDRFSVRYSVFAENLMPDITVTEKNR